MNIQHVEFTREDTPMTDILDDNDTPTTTAIPIAQPTMNIQHVEFTREDSVMTDILDDNDTPTTTAIPIARPEFPIVIDTITPREKLEILAHVINNDTTGVSRLLNDLAVRDRTIPCKILVQARDEQGRNALHLALHLANEDTLAMLTHLLHPSILPAVYPSLKKEFLNQPTLPSHGGDNPALYACRLAKSPAVVRALMAAGSKLTGEWNALGLDGLQCVLGPAVDDVDDERVWDKYAGARLMRWLVEGRLFRVGEVVLEGGFGGDLDVHLAARHNRVEELKAIVDMVGPGCLDEVNDKKLPPLQVALDYDSQDVVRYILDQV